MAFSFKRPHCRIDKELVRAATGLAIDEKELKAWVDLQIEVPAKTILTHFTNDAKSEFRSPI
jgi:hypothetical protein